MKIRSLSKKKLGEVAILSILIAALLFSCIYISSQKYFWNDELYSWYLLSDSSLYHMLQAFNDRINNSPILYFLLGWIWTKIFGHSELSLRLFSSLGFCIACIVVWITLRRNYDFWPSIVSTYLIFCTSEVILSQNPEARMYGLFLALCSIAVWQFDIFNKCKYVLLKNQISLLLVHAAIIHTHLFDPFYSGAIFLCYLWNDISLKRFRLRVYLSIILSWVSLIFYIPTFLIQADAGIPRSWVPTPSLRDLGSLVFFSDNSFLNPWYVVILLVFLSPVLGLRRGSLKSAELCEQDKVQKDTCHLIFLAYVLVLLPAAIWLISRTIKPIFWDRYMIPSAIGFAILIASLLSRQLVFRDDENKKTRFFLVEGMTVLALRRCVLFLFLFFVVFNPVSYALSHKLEALPGSQDYQYGYQNLPVVVQHSHDFLQRIHYSSQPEKYFFILDWESAVDLDSGLFPPQEYKHLEALNRRYPEFFSGQVIESSIFLREHPDFLVLDHKTFNKACSSRKRLADIHCPQWFEKRIMSNKRYKILALGDVGNRLLLLVNS